MHSSKPEADVIPLSAKSVDGEAPAGEFESSAVLRERCSKELVRIVTELEVWAREPKPLLSFGPQLLTMMLALGRLLYVFYLTCAEEVLSSKLPAVVCEGNSSYEKHGRQTRSVGTLFGKVSYWRTYMYCKDNEKGYYPLDDRLGMTRDGFSLPVIGWVTRLATRMSFDAAAVTFSAFLGWAPATRTIEEWVLGLGAHAVGYQEQAGPPPDDGDVLVIQVDSKGAPTATEDELRKRRGKRKPNTQPKSKRHRGRAKRQRQGPKKRRKKGDKSKNAKMATLVVLYTLESTTDQSGKTQLLGPLNIRVFASFAPKKYAFAVARREAIKRGFGPSSGKLIQFVSDGDPDLETYRREYFRDYNDANVITTIDLPHVLEYLWSAGASLHREGSGDLHAWVAKQKKRLLQSRSDLVCRELAQALEGIPKQGPGNKGKRTRVEDALRYLTNNADRMDYKRFASMDLELASGIVEGAVKHVIGRRFDHGGMRWIPQRAETLLQLRCIELNGQWEDFMRWLDNNISETTNHRSCYQLRRSTARPLPEVPPPCCERDYATEEEKAA